MGTLGKHADARSRDRPRSSIEPTGTMRPSMLTLSQRKMAMHRVSEAWEPASLRASVPELDTVKHYRGALKKAQAELLTKNKKLQSQYMKAAKLMEKEHDHRRQSLERDLKASAANQKQSLEREHKRRRQALKITTNNDIDSMRQLAEELEIESRDLDQLLEAEANLQRSALEQEVLKAKAVAFENVLKKKLALEVSVCEELHAMQLAELKRYHSEETVALELRQANELGQDLRAQAESEACDGNPTISPELQARHAVQLERANELQAQRVARLREDHSNMLGRLFTVYHAELAVLRETNSPRHLRQQTNSLATSMPRSLPEVAESPELSSRPMVTITATNGIPPPPPPPPGIEQKPGRPGPAAEIAKSVGNVSLAVGDASMSQARQEQRARSATDSLANSGKETANKGKSGAPQHTILGMLAVQSKHVRSQSQEVTPAAQAIGQRSPGIVSQGSRGTARPAFGRHGTLSDRDSMHAQADAVQAERARAEQAARQAREERAMAERLLADAAAEQEEATRALAEAEEERAQQRRMVEERARAERAAQQAMAEQEREQRAQIEEEALLAKTEREAAEAEAEKAKAERAMAEMARDKALAYRAQAEQAREEARLAHAQIERLAQQAQAQAKLQAEQPRQGHLRARTLPRSQPTAPPGIPPKPKTTAKKLGSGTLTRTGYPTPAVEEDESGFLASAKVTEQTAGISAAPMSESKTASEPKTRRGPKVLPPHPNFYRDHPPPQKAAAV